MHDPIDSATLFDMFAKAKRERADRMRRREFLSLVGGAALAHFAASPATASALNGCANTVARDDGGPTTSTTDDEPIDRTGLCSVADRLTASHANVHALVVARGGKLIFEHYFSGSDEIPGRIYGSRVENITFNADNNDEARMNMAWDPCRYVLGLPVSAPAGERFLIIPAP